MTEYIKREDAVNLIFEQFHMYFEVPCLPRDEAIQRQVCAVRDKINQLPAADVATVQHGTWIKQDGYTECSECEYWYNSSESEDSGDRSLYCPNCGAKMDLEEEA